jgi:glycosyltransferase involved in cell wall biosynthesis
VPIAFADKCQQIVPDKESITSTLPLCLFIGSYISPNVQGIEWFVKNVLPHVNIRLKIVGKGMAKLKENNTLFNDIEIVSDVPDMQPYFLEADFIVLPIFTGSGMKVKTCESLMYGKNILGTDEAFEGYSLDAEKVGGRCNNEKEFINCLNKYIQFPIPRFNNYSRRIYEQFYSEEASVKAFEDVFQ